MKNLWRLAFQKNSAAPGRKLRLLIYSIFVITQSSCVRWVAHGVELCLVCIWKYSYCWYSYFRVSVVLCLANRRRGTWTNCWKRYMISSMKSSPLRSPKRKSNVVTRNSSKSWVSQRENWYRKSSTAKTRSLRICPSTASSPVSDWHGSWARNWIHTKKSTLFQRVISLNRGCSCYVREWYPH